MADAMTEKVARELFEARHGHKDGTVPSQVEVNSRLRMASAALEACHHEELVEALEEINVTAQAVTNAGKNAKTIWAISKKARAVLAKVKDNGHG